MSIRQTAKVQAVIEEPSGREQFYHMSICRLIARNVCAMVLFVSFFFLLFGKNMYAETVPEKKAEISENLALGRPYTMQPTPYYKYQGRRMCTGPEDKTDLTDGKRVPSPMWFRIGAVGGWSRPIIVIDLGAQYPVGKVKVGSSKRVPGVGVNLCPFAMLLSKDNENFVYSDRTIAKVSSGDKSKYGPFSILDGDGLNSRYVMIVAGNTGLFFLDEIEVYVAGEEKTINNPLTFKREEVEKIRDLLRKPFLAKKKYQSFISDLTRLIFNDSANKEKDYLLAWLWDDLNTLNEKLKAGRDVPDMLNSLGMLNKERLASTHGTSLTAWNTDPYMAPEIFEVPVNPVKDARLSLLSRQKGIVAFNLVWCGNEPVSIKVKTKNAPSQSIIRQAVQKIGLKKGNLRQDALVKLNDRSVILKPGIVQQVLVTVPADNWSGEFDVIFEADGVETETANVRVTRSDVALPKTFDFKVWVWDYLASPHSWATSEQLAEFMKSYHVNMAVLSGSFFLGEKFDKNGNMTSSPNLTDFNKAIACQKNHCQFFYMFLDAKFVPKKKVGSKAWENAYSQCWKLVVKQFAANGITKDQIILAPLDENLDPVKWAAVRKLMNRIDPTIKLLCTRYIQPIEGKFEQALKYMNIFTVKDGYYGTLIEKNRLERIREMGIDTTMYNCEMDRDTNPMLYRQISWKARKLELSGLGIWTRHKDYSLWNESKTGWDMVYDGKNAPKELNVKEVLIPSRRLEAWRRGGEDWWILNTANRLALKRLENNPNDPVALLVVKLIDDTVEEVISRPADSAKLMRFTIKLLTEQLSELSKKK